MPGRKYGETAKEREGEIDRGIHTDRGGYIAAGQQIHWQRDRKRDSGTDTVKEKLKEGRYRKNNRWLNLGFFLYERD